jgi:hypothetical protein
MLDIHDNLPSAADSSWFVAKESALVLIYSLFFRLSAFIFWRDFSAPASLLPTMAVSSITATPSARRSSTMMVVVSLTLLSLVVATIYEDPSAEVVVAGSFSKRQGCGDIKDNLRRQQSRTLQESFDDPIGSQSLQDDPFFDPELMNTIINGLTNSSSGNNMTNATMVGGLTPEEFANLTPEEFTQIMEQGANDDEMATLYQGMGSVITNLTEEVLEGANNNDEGGGGGLSIEDLATLYQGIGPAITNLTEEVLEGQNNNDGGGGGLSIEDLATLYQGIGPVITNLTDTAIDEFFNASSEMSIEDMLADLANATSSSSSEEEDYYDDAVTGTEEDEGVVPDYSNATDFSTEGGQNFNEQGVEGGNDDGKVGYDDTNSEEDEDFTSPPAMSSSGGNLNEDESEYNLYPTPVPEPEYSWYGNGGTDEVDDEYESNIEEGAGDDEYMAGDDKNGDGIPDEFESMTTRPTAAYIPPPNDEDPLAEEEEMEEEEDHVLYHGLGGTAGAYLDGVESPLEMEKDKNVQVTVGILISLFVIILLVTASLVMNYPDGLCAGCCRLTLKVLSCCFRTLCLPCRAICCGGSEQLHGRRTHAPMRSPFPSDLELT